QHGKRINLLRNYGNGYSRTRGTKTKPLSLLQRIMDAELCLSIPGEVMAKIFQVPIRSGLRGWGPIHLRWVRSSHPDNYTRIRSPERPRRFWVWRMMWRERGRRS